MKTIKHHEIIRISISAICNLNCFYCNNEGQQKLKIKNGDVPIGLSAKRFKDLLPVLKDAGVVGGAVTGGEPLLNPNWQDYLASFIEEFGPSTIHLTTNGTISRKEDIDFLSRITPGRVTVSLDTVDRIKYKKITGHDSLQNAMDFLQELTRAGVCTSVNTVVLKGINDSPYDIKNHIISLKDKTNRITFLRPVNTPVTPNLCKTFLPNLETIIATLDALCDSKEFKDYTNRDRVIVYKFEQLHIHIRDTIYNFHNEICQNCKYNMICTEGIIHPRMDISGKISACLFRSDLSINLDETLITESKECATKKLRTFFDIFNNNINGWVVGWKK